jgi:hypothetical protein
MDTQRIVSAHHAYIIAFYVQKYEKSDGMREHKKSG